MKYLEGELKGKDSNKLYYQGWIPDDPKAVIQIIHGFAEHSSRYKNVIDTLIPLNFAVYAHDLRGHGKSEGEQHYIDSMDQLIEDEMQFFNLVKNNHPNLKIFILGHSMGSAIAMYFTKKHENLVGGLILSGSGKYFGGEVGKLKKAFAKQMSKTFPKLKAASGVKPQFLSHDSEVVNAYKTDPLIHYKKITARLGWEMIRSFEESPDIVKDLKLPVLIQKGAEDDLMTGIEELKEAFKTKDLTFNLYEGLYHEIYNELEQDRKKVLKDLSDWLEKHI